MVSRSWHFFPISKSMICFETAFLLLLLFCVRESFGNFHYGVRFAWLLVMLKRFKRSYYFIPPRSKKG